MARASDPAPVPAGAPGTLAAGAAFVRTLGRETLRIFASTPRVLAMVWRASPGRVAWLAVLTVAQGLMPTATVWVSKLVVDAVVAAVSSGGDPASINLVVRLVVVQFALGAIGIALGHASSIVQQRLTDVVGHTLNVQVLARANALDLAHFETPEFYDRLRNAQRLGSQPVQLVTGGLLQLARNAIVLVSMVALLARFHALLPVAIVVASLPHLLAQMYYGRFGWRLMHRQAPLWRRQNYLSGVMTGDSHAKEIRIFGLGDHLLGRYVETAQEVIRQDWDFRSRRRRATSLLNLLSTGVTSLAYLYAALQAAFGRIGLGDLTLYSGAVRQAQGTLEQLLNGITQIYETNLQVDDLFTFLDFQPAVVSGPRRLPVPRPLRHGIEFRDVHFSYPFSAAAPAAGETGRAGRPPWLDRRGGGFDGSGGGRGSGRGGPAGPREVLKGVSFVMPAGNTVAIVGANGAGKTTLVKLLARLYDPTAGDVLLDGVSLRDYDLDDLRRQVAVVFQDYARFQLPARDNVGFGQVSRLADLERIATAARQGGAAPAIERLPEGYETTLGRMFSGGVELSGGEWQKVALSRAFMRTPVDGRTGGDGANGANRANGASGAGNGAAEHADAAQILVLDEPTAALDAQAEYEVYERFQELTRGKTTLLISHRFSTVRMADHIVVLEHGRVAEQGSHADLMAAGGVYARLYEMQAGRYR